MIACGNHSATFKAKVPLAAVRGDTTLAEVTQCLFQTIVDGIKDGRGSSKDLMMRSGMKILGGGNRKLAGCWPAGV